jgi:hypothetical protein
MRHHIRTAIALALVVAGSFAILDAQRPRASPRDKVAERIDEATISIDYSRPFAKGRTIFAADGLVPFGKVWRTGADQATTLTTDATLVFGTLTVPPGTYTLYTIPGEKEWTLIVNKQTGQWGTVYDEAQDLGRVPMKVAALNPALEQFEIDLEDTPAGGELTFAWAGTKAVAPFTVKK